MGVTFKYWDDCAEPEDIEEMWSNPDVSKEWLDAGETKGRKVLLSRDPDGQPYLTQTEMKAVTKIIVDRHFRMQIDPDIICAIAEIESDRQLLSKRYNKKTKETSLGLLSITPAIEEHMFSQLHYWAYNIDGNPDQLHKPFINVYFGAAYLIWLSVFDGKERNEEFMIRAFRGGTKKATHKSTLIYWERYLSVRQSLPATREPLYCENFDNQSTLTDAGPSIPSPSTGGPVAVDKSKYWDSRVSPEDMEELWRHPDVLKEWTKSGEKRGVVRFSRDKEKRPYLSRTEIKSVAEIIICRYFNTRGIEPAVLCALGEISSMRFVNGVGSHIGLMGMDYQTATWLHNDLGWRAYRIRSADDLLNPFASMYYGAAYLIWLSTYEGRERTHEFIIQAYIGGPQKVNIQETGPLWSKFQNAYSLYRDPKKEGGSCSIL